MPSTARRGAIGVGIVFATIVLACGGGLGLVNWAVNRPPDTEMFLPLQPGIEIVSTSGYNERVDDRTWNVRELVLKSTDGKRDEELLNYVGREYGDYKKRNIYQGVDGRLSVDMVPNEPTMVRIKYGTSM